MSSVDQHMSDLGIVPDHLTDFTKGLRALAAFLEDHPTLFPEWEAYEFSIFTSSKDEFAQMVKEVGTGAKDDVGGYLEFSRKFSNRVKLTVNISKNLSCEKVQTGTKTKTIEVPATAHAEIDEDGKVIYEVEEPVYEWKCPESWLNPVSGPDPFPAEPDPF